MQISHVLLAALAGLPLVLAGRGSDTEKPPTICNNDPDQSPTDPEKRDALLLEREVGPTTPVAAARHHSRDLTRFAKRGGTVNYADSCNNAPPAGSRYNAGSGFPTMRSVLESAYQDAVDMATSVLTGPTDINSDTQMIAHYFGGQLVDDQINHFLRMMQAISSDDHDYTIQFECSNIPSCSEQMSAMVTDSSVGGPDDQKVIQVCDRFWTSASTKYLIYRQDKTSPSPPFRNNDASGWCSKRNVNGDPNVSTKNGQFFATAGHTVIHELTHLDALATLVGLEPDAADRHGTIDAQNDCELDGARLFLIDYKVGGTKGTSPDYNAESYAAAATEIYFANLCGFSKIQPV